MKKQKLITSILFLFVIVFQISIGYVTYLSFDTWPIRGTFGDMFGVVNTFFSGFAFAGVVYAIILQKEELHQNTEALRMQADELKKSVDNQEKNLRSSVLNQLTERMIQINKYFMNSNLPNPYDDDQEKSRQANIDYEKKGTALFLHLNLLYLMYENRDILGGRIEVRSLLSKLAEDCKVTP